MMENTLLTPAQRVALARMAGRPSARDYIGSLIDDFFEISGDRHYGEDRAVVCGIGAFMGIPVTVAGHCKGRTLEENLAVNFGMPGPEGYRKFQRALAQAVKFGRPVITFVDTPGAFPGKGAEERGQGEAIARCLSDLSAAPVPVIAVITGEGGSGGALALALGDRVLMLENAVYSVLSPEGFASILWKDAARRDEAAQVMKLTAADLLEYGVADRVLPEPEGGAHQDPAEMIRRVGEALSLELPPLMKLSAKQLLKNRYMKYRAIGL